MNEETLAMFRTLTELPGAPGFEHAVRRYVREQIEPVTDEIVQDRLGSVFGVLRGDEQGPKILVNGHMDEVGFFVTAIQDNGLIRFQTLGGWWSQVMLSQRVNIVTKTGLIPGVISSTPRHLLSEAQLSKPAEIGSMFIDIGADSSEQALELGVRLGLSVVPSAPFTPLAGGKKILAKAWDNRFGVGLAIELLKEMKNRKHPNILYAGATVQEEVGMRGAQTAAGLVSPDVCYTLEAGPANDIGGDKYAFGQLGKGAAVRILDSSIVTNRNLIDFIVDTAETHRIPYQYYISPGATDAGRIHLHGKGVVTAAIGVAARYIHTSGSMIHVDDYAAAKELLIKLVEATDRTMLDTITEYA